MYFLYFCFICKVWLESIVVPLEFKRLVICKYVVLYYIDGLLFWLSFCILDAMRTSVPLPLIHYQSLEQKTLDQENVSGQIKLNAKKNLYILFF